MYVFFVCILFINPFSIVVKGIFSLKLCGKSQKFLGKFATLSTLNRYPLNWLSSYGKIAIFLTPKDSDFFFSFTKKYLTD